MKRNRKNEMVNDFVDLILADYNNIPYVQMTTEQFAEQLKSCTSETEYIKLLTKAKDELLKHKLPYVKKIIEKEILYQRSYILGIN